MDKGERLCRAMTLSVINVERNSHLCLQFRNMKELNSGARNVRVLE